MILRLTAALLVFANATVHAQQAAVPAVEQMGAAARDNLNALGRGDAAIVRRPTSEGVMGSPYVENRWLLAQITLSNALPLAPVPLKYDVLNSRLLMRPLNRPHDSLQLDDRLVVRFELQQPVVGTTLGRRRVFRRFVEAPVPYQRNEYVEVLHEGRYCLLKRYVKVLRKANNTGAYNRGEQFDEIEDKNSYFLRHPDARLVPVKLSLKALQAAAPEFGKALKESAAAQTARTDADWSAVFDTLDPA